MAPEKNNEGDIKLLYACLAFNSSNDIDMDKVAAFMDLTKGAADKRFSRLKAKLMKTYKHDASAGPPPAITSGKGRKRGRKTKEEPTPSKKPKNAVVPKNLGEEEDDDCESEEAMEEAEEEDVDGK